MTQVNRKLNMFLSYFYWNILVRQTEFYVFADCSSSYLVAWHNYDIIMSLDFRKLATVYFYKSINVIWSASIDRHDHVKFWFSFEDNLDDRWLNERFDGKL